MANGRDRGQLVRGKIRIYVEGGGDGKDTRASLRKGFNGFFKDIVDSVREKQMHWDLITCGSRNSTLDDFNTALRTHPDSFNILLVDSESAVKSDPRSHLKSRDGWDLSHVDDEQCHLMVQSTETWLIVDVSILERFYGQGFIRNRIPKNPQVEQIEKAEVKEALEEATHSTKKGAYHKTRHLPEILKRLDPVKVQSAAPHCKRLFRQLNTLIDQG